MKGFEILENYCKAKEEKKPQSTKIPLLKKVDLLYNFYNEMKSYDKKKLNAIKKQVITVLDSLCDEGSGVVLTRLITRLYEEIFDQVDRSRIPEFFDKEIQIISSGKSDSPHQMNHLYIIGKIYKRFASGMISIPSKELVAAIIKLLRNSTEWYTKESVLVCLRRVIKGRSSSINNHWADIFKAINRYTSDKSVEVRTQAAKCYKAIAQSIYNTSFARSYENIYQAAIKGFEDDESSIRGQYVEALALTMANKLQEITSIEVLNAVSKRRLSDPPKSFMDVYNTFLPLIEHENNHIRECSVSCMHKVMKYSPKQLRLTKPLSLLQLELTYLSKNSSSLDNYKSRIHLCWIVNEYSKLLDLPTLLKLKDDIFIHLNNILKQSNKEQQTNDKQIILLLSTFSSLVIQLGSHIVDHNTNLNQIAEIVNPFLIWKSLLVRLTATECVKVLMYRCQLYVFQLLSLFLNMTTVAYAEFAAQSPAPLFIGLKGSGEESLRDYYMTLNVYSNCLASLLYCTEGVLHGVPLDIVNSAFASAKGMILGYNEEEIKRMPIGPIIKELTIKKHSGWIIIQGLIGLGRIWVSDNISGLMKLCDSAMNKEIYIMTKEQKKDADLFVQNFIVKSEALRVLHDLLHNYKDLLDQQMMKSVILTLIHYTSYLFQNNTKESKKVTFDMFPIRYSQMKLDLLESLSIIPSYTYEEIHVLLLHKLADIITTSNVSPSNYKHWEPLDELILISKDDSSESLVISTENYIGVEEPDLRIYNCPTQLIYSQGENDSIQRKLLDTAIEVYSQILCNPHLSHKNRIQLCKHLQIHIVQGDIKRQFTIIIVCYSIARELLKNVSSCAALPEPGQVFITLRSIAESACNSSDRLSRILGCELLVLLHRAFSEILPNIHSDLILEMGKLTEANDVLSRTKATLITGYIFKYFNLDQLQLSIQAIEKAFTMQLRDSNTLIKFNSFFIMYLALKYTGNTFIDIIKNNIWLCLHNYNTEIRLDKMLFLVMCKIFELIVRINPSADNGMLPLIVFESLSLLHNNNSSVSTTILKLIKSCLLCNVNVITPTQCIDAVLRNIKNPNGVGLQILGILIYKGHYKTLIQTDNMIAWKLLDELNIIKYGNSGTSYQFNKKQAKQLFKLNPWKQTFEEIFNIDNILESNDNKISELMKENIYEYTLKQLIIFLFTKLKEEKDSIVTIIDMVKYVLTYRITDEEDVESGRFTMGENKEGIMSKDKVKDTSFKFSKNIRITIKCFIIKLLTKLILNENKESELILLVRQFHNVLAIAFAFINIEGNPHKGLVLKLITTIMKKCKGVKDMVEGLNDEQESAELHSGLEQFEAQIDALIRQYSTKDNSCETLRNAFSIFYYFCTIPISRNTSTLGKLMTQLTEPLKELVLVETMEFSCEKQALKCHFKRLKVLCKLFFAGINANSNSHLEDKENSKTFLRPSDKKRIQDLFTESVNEKILSHVMAALSDCWFILTQNKKIAKQKDNYVLIHSGVPSAFSIKSCESAVICFLKYISLCSDKPQVHSLLRENENLAIPFILQCLSKKPELKPSSESDGDILEKLGENLLQKNELLLIFGLFMRNLQELEISEELLIAGLELMEKLTDAKILEFSQSIVQVIDELCNNLTCKRSEISRCRVFLICEEILGKVWLQAVNPQSQEEATLFIRMHNCWSKILSYYGHNSECESQFQLTFNTIIINLNSLISTSEINTSKAYARLCITAIKTLLLELPEDFVKVEVCQFLQIVSSFIQRTEEPNEKTEILIIIAINCALSLGSLDSPNTSKTANEMKNEIVKSFSVFTRLYDVPEYKSQLLQTSMALIKSIMSETKTNAFYKALLEYLLLVIYRGIEMNECKNVGLTLQLIVTLYQAMKVDSESLFWMLFAAHFSFCSSSFPKSVLKESLDSMNVLLTLNPRFFKVAVSKLNPKEVRYLQLLMKLNASNKII